MRDAARWLTELYGTTPVDQFGPIALKQLRQSMVDQKHRGKTRARTYINSQINRVRRIFKWGVSEELLPSAVHEALKSVEGLKFGRTEARETDPIEPVPDAWVDAVKPFVAPPVRAMMELQRLTGIRSDNLTAMRACDIDMGDGWHFRPGIVAHLGRVHRLKGKLFALLKAFVEAKGPVTRDKLRSLVWDDDPQTDDASIRVSVGRLRKELRIMHGWSPKFDPLLAVDWGGQTAWELRTPAA